MNFGFMLERIFQNYISKRDDRGVTTKYVLNKTEQTIVKLKTKNTIKDTLLKLALQKYVLSIRMVVRDRRKSLL